MRTKLVIAGVAVATVMLAPTASATTTHEAEWKRCGSQAGKGAGWYGVRADHVSCKDARAVARKYYNDGSSPGHVKVDGITYHCSEEQAGEEVWRVRCNATGDRRVRFKYGA